MATDPNGNDTDEYPPLTEYDAPERHETPDGESRGLGCRLPATFPTGKAFADLDGVRILTLDEIRNTLAGAKNFFNRRETFGPAWIGNQRTTSACNGWMTARALSRSIFLRSGVTVLLSGADAYSQMNGGRDNGSALADGMRICMTNGIAPESMVPWNQIFSHQISAEAKAARSRFKGFELYAVDTQEELASGLLAGFVGGVAVHVANGFDAQDSDGVCRGGNGPGNHAVCVDDMGMLASGELVFDMPNSWGTTWGDQGRTRLTWNRHLRQSVQNHRFFLIRSAIDDSQGTNPPDARP